MYVYSNKQFIEAAVFSKLQNQLDFPENGLDEPTDGGVGVAALRTPSPSQTYLPLKNKKKHSDQQQLSSIYFNNYLIQISFLPTRPCIHGQEVQIRYRIMLYLHN